MVAQLNLTKWSPDQKQALLAALRGPLDLPELGEHAPPQRPNSHDTADQRTGRGRGP